MKRPVELPRITSRPKVILARFMPKVAFPSELGQQVETNNNSSARRAVVLGAGRRCLSTFFTPCKKKRRLDEMDVRGKLLAAGWPKLTERPSRRAALYPRLRLYGILVYLGKEGGPRNSQQLCCTAPITTGQLERLNDDHLAKAVG